MRPEQQTTMKNTHTTLINEAAVAIPEHFSELNEVKLKYHLQVEELEEA